jgi:hypothetical protein
VLGPTFIGMVMRRPETVETVITLVLITVPLWGWLVWWAVRTARTARTARKGARAMWPQTRRRLAHSAALAGRRGRPSRDRLALG